jgi:hypothetical protein
MKVYGKLAQARKMLQDSNLKKTGKGYGFNYFELADFLPRTTEIFAQLNLASFTNISVDRAQMTIADGEDGSTIVFEIPFASFKSDDKRALQAVQELGGSITYLTRYLWVQVMNIVEPDDIDRDKTSTQKQVVTETTQETVTEKQFEKIFWDGHSPIKQFDHFMVGNLEYITMKNKDGQLFGLITDKSVTDPKIKYYKFQ